MNRRVSEEIGLRRMKKVENACFKGFNRPFKFDIGRLVSTDDRLDS